MYKVLHSRLPALQEELLVTIKNMEQLLVFKKIIVYVFIKDVVSYQPLIIPWETSIFQQGPHNCLFLEQVLVKKVEGLITEISPAVFIPFLFEVYGFFNGKLVLYFADPFADKFIHQCIEAGFFYFQ